MSDTTNAVPGSMPTKHANLKDIEAVRDLFARAHEYIAQANHPGYLGMKVAEVLNFLAFQYNDFKLRGENLAKVIKAETKAELDTVDIKAAQEAVAATLMPEAKAAATDTTETPKA